MNISTSNTRRLLWVKIVAILALIDFFLLIPHAIRAMAGGPDDVFLAKQFGWAFLFLLIGGKIRGWSESGPRREEPNVLGRVIGMGIIIVGFIFMCRGILRLLHLW